MKVQVVGFEVSEGTSKKGAAYAIGQLHTLVRLAAPFTKGNVSKGQMGKMFRCEVSLLRKIEHLEPPLVCEVEFDMVMRFGAVDQEIVSVVPVARFGEPARPPAPALAKA